jgi:hypothetical protein
MGWMIIITLLICYALGVMVFHTNSVEMLPGIALLVLIADRWLMWKYSRDGGQRKADEQPRH